MKKFLAFGLFPVAFMAHAQTTYIDGGGTLADPDPVTAVATTRATALGVDATAGNRSTALGFESEAIDRSVSIGVTSNATTVSVGIGNDASAADRSIAIGSNAAASDRSTAIGINSSATGASISLGNQSVSSDGSVAVGVGASATGVNSVAIGTGSVATRDNTFSVGSETSPRTVSNVADGQFASDAVNMGQLWRLERDMSRGIASAIALSNVVTPSAPGKITVSLGGGFFNGESAAGFNAAYAVPAWAANRGMLGFGLATTSSAVTGTTGKVFAGFEF